MQIYEYNFAQNVTIVMFHLAHYGDGERLTLFALLCVGGC